MKKGWFLLLIILIIIAFLIGYYRKKFFSRFFYTSIKVGVIHSLTGDLSISEQPVAEATLVAIKEINKNGGLLGRLIEPIMVDGKSDEKIFGQEAERLIKEEHAIVIFGGWTSPSRIAIKNIAEKYNVLYFYPVQFEGLEVSENVVYTSTTPNQQFIPGVTWCLRNLGTRFFLVGSDHIVHEIIKDILYAHGGTIVGTEYLALNDKNINPIIDKIIETEPDVILNNIEGVTNIAFFEELRKRGITPEKIPTMSFSISEPELDLFNTDSMRGDYATWSYFESIENNENMIFKKKFEINGNKHVMSDAMEAAYFGVYLWKQAVEKAHSIKTDKVRIALYNQAYNAPQGIIHIDENILQTWSWVRIGKIRSDNQFSIVWSSEKSVDPMSYPPTRSIPDWDNVRMLAMELESHND